MTTQKKLKKRSLFLIVIGLSVLTLTSISTYGLAADTNEARIIKINDSAYVIRNGTTVKRSASLGETLHYGDSIEVTRGNTVRISFDDGDENVVQLVGPANVQVSNGYVIHLNLKRGKMLALMDNMKELGGAEVTTPEAIASFRGSYFQVKTEEDTTTAKLFEGQPASIVGKDQYGQATQREYLEAGTETTVGGFGQIPLKPILLLPGSYDDINSMITTLDKKRTIIDFKKIIKKYKTRHAKISQTQKRIRDTYDNLVAERNGANLARQDKVLISDRSELDPATPITGQDSSGEKKEAIEILEDSQFVI